MARVCWATSCSGGGGGSRLGAGRLAVAEPAPDGPLIEVKEIVGGYMIVSASSLDEAIEVARECPGLVRPGSGVEVIEIHARMNEALGANFFRHEYARLVAMLVRRLGARHVEAVEDAVQSALLAAVEAWPRSTVPDSPSAWLYRVARHHFASELRFGELRGLVREDDPVGQKLASALLTRLGCTVDLATNGKEGPAVATKSLTTSSSRIARCPKAEESVVRERRAQDAAAQGLAAPEVVGVGRGVREKSAERRPVGPRWAWAPSRGASNSGRSLYSGPTGGGAPN